MSIAPAAPPPVAEEPAARTGGCAHQARDAATLMVVLGRDLGRGRGLSSCSSQSLARQA